MATPSPVFMSDPQTTDLKLGVHTQLEFGSNMHCVSPGHTFSS